MKKLCIVTECDMKLREWDWNPKEDDETLTAAIPRGNLEQRQERLAGEEGDSITDKLRGPISPTLREFLTRKGIFIILN